MVKITHKGMWIEMSSLNPTDKKNYIKAFACFMFGAVLLGIHLAEVGFLGDDALNQIPEPWLLIIRTLMIALFFIGAFFTINLLSPRMIYLRAIKVPALLEAHWDFLSLD